MISQESSLPLLSLPQSDGLCPLKLLSILSVMYHIPATRKVTNIGTKKWDRRHGKPARVSLSLWNQFAKGVWTSSVLQARGTLGIRVSRAGQAVPKTLTLHQPMVNNCTLQN